MRSPISRRIASILAVFVTAGAFLKLAVWLLDLVAPQFSPGAIRPYLGYDSETMRAAVAPPTVRAHHKEIVANGSRFLGQPAFYETEAWIRRSFAQAGLEILEQPVEIVTPRTLENSITAIDEESGDALALPDVEVYPFFPNHAQPVVTPPGGLEGKLVLLDEETVNERTSFHDVIGVVDAAEGRYLERFAFDWKRYAALGLPALIVTHHRDWEYVDWGKVADKRSGIVSSVPVNYVRLAATPSILQHLEKRVRLEVRSAFKRVYARNLIGILKADRPTREALVITAPYDAVSIVPDVAPGVLSAWAPAIQQALAKGLVPYRNSLRRDVIFVALAGHSMGSAGLANFLRVLQLNDRELSSETATLDSEAGDTVGHRHGLYQRRRLAVGRERRIHTDRLEQVRHLRRLFSQSSFLVDSGDTQRSLQGVGEGSRRFLEDQFRTLVDREIFGRAEPLLQAKLAFEEAGGYPDSQEFHRFRRARVQYDEMVALGGYRLATFLELDRESVRAFALRGRMEGRLSELARYHERRLEGIDRDADLVEIFRPYDHVGFLEVALTPDEGTGAESLSFDSTNSTHTTQFEIGGTIREASFRLGIQSAELHIPVIQRLQSAEVGLNLDRDFVPDGFPACLNNSGFHGYSFMNFGRRSSYAKVAYPVALEFMEAVDSMRHSLSVTGETILSLAHGKGRFFPAFGNRQRMKDYRGRVLVANIGTSMVPDSPLADALVLARSRNYEPDFSHGGFFKHTMVLTDPYGEFALPDHSGDFVNHALAGAQSNAFTPIALAFGEDGLIRYMKDEGPTTQRLFKSILLPLSTSHDLDDINVVLFRAAPVCVADLVSPQNLRDFSFVQPIYARGMTAFRKFCRFRNPGVEITFIEPDQRYYLELQAGAPDNELVQMTRAFMTGVEGEIPAYGAETTLTVGAPEIAGRGYLSHGNGIIANVPLEIARSMAVVNERRLAIQGKYQMADEQTLDYQKTALGKLAESEGGGLSRIEARQRAREAVTYSMLIHPVIRESIFEAVVGILWYLFLLVPFLFFFEKLVFGFSDLRRQLIVQILVFLSVFSLLRFLHPAFQMVRSSLMILLGFLILIISAAITILFTEKFQENLDELRRKRGRVLTAEVNTLGVMMTAFMLGLNNMHRRRVRTGLTCATLVFLVFALIVFSSLQTDTVERDIALGKAHYQGLLIKRERFRPISDGELDAVSDRFSGVFPVCPRRILIGQERSTDRMRFNPELKIVRHAGVVERSVPFESVLRFTPSDPILKHLVLAAGVSLAEENAGKPPALLIPERMAEELGISRRALDREPVVVSVNGAPCRVTGIFYADTLEELVDLDGHDLLPFDIESMPDVVIEKGRALAEADAPRVTASSIVISHESLGSVPFAHENINSIAVNMEGVRYADARQAVDEYLEHTRQAAFFGLDGVAFQGTRTRRTTAEGAIDLIIPLILAALTVLNTMRGSVYERRDEIYVYNSVGIAPRYVFFMFFAEAFVYSVIGSVLGYLMSQSVGRFLMEMGWNGGLNMTFTSLNTVYASLALTAATFASTYFPARMAMELAAPAEESGWSLPEPADGSIRLALPFTFSRQESLAVLEFVDRFLQDHGEGGSGRFYSGMPSLAVRPETLDRHAALIPSLTADLWLKPYDLGVSQSLCIGMVPDPATNLIQATVELTRRSGTHAAWVRLNHGFMSALRRQFLHWRAVSRAEQQELFQVARKRLEATATVG